MARFAHAGHSQVHVVDTIANTAAPTIAEIQAGDEITSFIAEMPSVPSNQDFLDASDASSRRRKTVPGMVGGGEGDFMWRREDDNTEDTLTALFPDLGETHLVIVTRTPAAGVGGALAAADVVTVVPIQVGSIDYFETRSLNEVVSGRVRYAITGDVQANVAIAA